MRELALWSRGGGGGGGNVKVVQFNLPGLAVRGRLKEALEWTIRNESLDWAPATLQAHEDHMGWLLGYFGDCLLEEITYERLAEYKQKEGPTGRGLKVITLKKRLVLLRMALQDAVRRGIIEKVPPWPKLKNDARPGTRCPSLAEIDQVRQVIDVDKHRLWQDIAYWTGMRKSDVSRTRWRHFSFDGDMFVRRSTKTHAQAELFPLDPALKESLLYYKELWRPQPMDYCAGMWDASHGLARYCRRAGVEVYGPNDLRRARESHLIAAGANPTFVELLLCHGPAVAKKHYRRTTPELLAEGVKAMRKVG